MEDLCTQLVPTNHGVPAGDSWYVICILSLAYVWSLSIRRQSSECFLSAYADKWAWAANNQLVHQHILLCTNAFANMTSMVVDWPKCWGWATNADMFKLLQRAVATIPAAHELQRKLNAMDLGAQHTYQGWPKLGKFRQRLDRALGHMPGSFGCRRSFCP